MRIDCHNHLHFNPLRMKGLDAAVAHLRKLGVDKACSCDVSASRDDDGKAMREGNDQAFEVMRRHPDFVLGLCAVNPGYPKDALDEMTRCVVDGRMIGVKLYNQYFMSEPVQFPIIERCIDLGVPILMHAGHLTNPPGQSSQPRISSGEHFAEAAKRYPEAMLICGHIGGGGDWFWQIKGLLDAPSVYLDTSGGGIDRGMIEQCVRDLGAERLLFGTDMSHERGVGKILDANITKRQREMIFGGNFEKILARRKA